MAINVVRNDITKMDTEAIVNTANSDLTYGAGIDCAVYKAAGEEKLMAARRAIGVVEEGEVFITPGFDLPAKYIIHVVSPLYKDGESGEEEKLRNCYRKALQLAEENNIKSISFPLISTGSYGYPKADGLRIAMDECNAYLLKKDMDIRIVVFDSRSTMMAEKIFPKLEAYIDHFYVCEKRQEEYGDAYYDSTAPSDKKYDKYMDAVARMERRLSRMNPLSSFGKSKAGAAEDSTPHSIVFSKAMPQSSAMPGRKYDEPDDEKAVDRTEWAGEFDIESGLAKRVAHISDSFGTYVLYLAERKGLNSTDVQNRGWLDHKLYSKMKSNKETYQPTKRTACQYCVGLGLNYDESKDLLMRAGLSLSPSILEDVIWQFFFEMDPDDYDIFDISDALEEHGLKPIVVLESNSSKCV